MNLQHARGWRWVFARSALLYLWLPVLAISIAHVVTPSSYEWLHDVYRRLYYIPILVGGFLHGTQGGLFTAGLASALYIPHAFFLVGPHAHHQGMLHADPTGTANKILEIGLYHAVGLLTGLLVERERAARREVERKMAEMEAMEKQLIRAGKLHALGEMSAGLAHEIKNPLASLKTAVEIVADEISETSPRRKMIAVLRNELDRLAMLLERFLAFARPGELTLGKVHIARVVAEAVALVAPQAKVRRVELCTAIQNPDGYVWGDAAKMTQVLLNILLNAIQFSPEDSTVEIQEERQDLPHGRYLVIGVRDHGPGIPPSQREQIFDPFYSTRPQGTGLGLSIASRLMDEHHGAIEVHDAPGGGTLFRLLIPWASDDATLDS